MEIQTASAEALLRQRQNEFIEKRTIIESEVNKYLEGMNAESPAFQQRCGYDLQGKTAKDILSAAWADEFDQKLYDEQMASFMEYVNRSVALAEQLNMEALQCLQNAR